VARFPETAGASPSTSAESDQDVVTQTAPGATGSVSGTNCTGYRPICARCGEDRKGVDIWKRLILGAQADADVICCLGEDL